MSDGQVSIRQVRREFLRIGSTMTFYPDDEREMRSLGKLTAQRLYRENRPAFDRLANSILGSSRGDCWVSAVLRRISRGEW